MALIDFPDPIDEAAASIVLSMIDTLDAVSSPFTLQQQFFDYEARRWGLQITTPPLSRAAAGQWIAFLAALGGRRNTFMCGVPGSAKPRGAASLTAGAPRLSQEETGEQIRVDGAPASVSQYLRPGDFVEVASRLYTVTRNVSTDSNGEASIFVWPAIINPVPNNTPVVVSGAKGEFRLVDDMRSVDVTKFDTYGVTIKAESVI